jgi:hypothetical protein
MAESAVTPAAELVEEITRVSTDPLIAPPPPPVSDPPATTPPPGQAMPPPPPPEDSSSAPFGAVGKEVAEGVIGAGAEVLEATGPVTIVPASVEKQQNSTGAATDAVSVSILQTRIYEWRPRRPMCL